MDVKRFHHHAVQLFTFSPGMFPSPTLQELDQTFVSSSTGNSCLAAGHPREFQTDSPQPARAGVSSCLLALNNHKAHLSCSYTGKNTKTSPLWEIKALKLLLAGNVRVNSNEKNELPLAESKPFTGAGNQAERSDHLTSHIS